MPGMDQRELESRVKALTKVVAANEPPENALKLLESLKKDASPTEEMLRVRLILSPFFCGRSTFTRGEMLGNGQRRGCELCAPSSYTGP